MFQCKISVAVKAGSARVPVFCSVALAASLAACGQRGPLYLADRTSVPVAASKPAQPPLPPAAAASAP
ncbi:MAG: lipoprotein [Bacteriovorax sp.]|nr:lipoprotein [Rhizobacter sp.]